MVSTYFIVGASRGIGLEFIKQLLENDIYKGSKVIAGARDPNLPALLELKKDHPKLLTLVALDVTSDESVKEASKKITASHPDGIDFLVVNAGVVGTSDLTSKEFHAIFDVNVVGALRVITNFLPLVRKGSRKVISTVSSLAGSIHAQDFIAGYYRAIGKTEHTYAYRVSKGALNLLTTAFAKDYASEGFIIVPVHPGMVETEMYYASGAKKEDNPNLISPTESALKQLELLNKLKLEDTGKFFSYNGDVLPA